MSKLPEKVRITNMGWTESKGAYKVQIGTSERTIAYAWVPGVSGDATARDKAVLIAERLCEGWNSLEMHP